MSGFLSSGARKLVLLSGLALAITATAAGAQPAQPTLKILSSPAYAVSGGDALAEVQVPASIPLSDVSIRLNGVDVTGGFHTLGTSSLRGLVSGLKVGPNVLNAVSRATGQTYSKILVTNYPRNGPIFSGPHQTPFVCETDFQGLGPPIDSDCNAPTRVDYYYRSTTTNSFQPFNTSGPRPSDLAMTTTNEGMTVPYIVRREMGTINRAVYMVAILHDPTDYPMFSTALRTFGTLMVLARVEWHPPDFLNGTVHRGVTLYEPG